MQIPLLEQAPDTFRHLTHLFGLCACLVMLAATLQGGETVLVGSALNNGDFNAPGSTGSISFANTPAWVNIGTGNQTFVALRDDESYDGTHNAVVAGNDERTQGLDTGHTIQTGDIFSLGYVWRDSYQWETAEDQIVVRLFTTTDNTITGTPEVLASASSGISSMNATYELVDQANVYMARPADAGKRLFVALDTFTTTPNRTGFARMDNFQLTVKPYKLALSPASESEWDASWPAIPDRHYTLLHSANLYDWTPVQKHLPAEERIRLSERVHAGDADHGFFMIRQEVDSGMVDPTTPENAQPFLNTPTGDNWVLDFSDEFNGTEVDARKWMIDDSSRSRAPRSSRGIHAWFWRPQNVSVSGGNLVLDVVKDGDHRMHCGSIRSTGKYETTYGYLEARVKIGDTTKDTHTAFWLQGKDMNTVTGSANNGAEVDVFESAWFGDFTKAVVHIDGYADDRKSSTKQYSTPGMHSGFNVFGLHWTANEMRIYYNGQHKVTYTGNWVPLVPEWLWLSNGASFGDEGTFSEEPLGWLTSASFDYVRVWKSR